jgi:hypothetical protein
MLSGTPGSFNSVNLIAGGIITNWVAQKFGLPSDPVSTMIGTAAVSNGLSFIHDNVSESKLVQNMGIHINSVKRALGLSKCSIVIDQESIFYQKIISYLLLKYKNILVSDSIEHNYNIDADITNIRFTTNQIVEDLDTHKIFICLNYSSKDIVVESYTLDVIGLKKYVQSIVSKNTASTYLNLFLPTIIHETGPSKKKSRSNSSGSGSNSSFQAESTNTIVRWKNLRVHTNKNLANTILSTQVQTELVDDLNNFIASEEYYNTKGIPYKRGYLLHGPPGTGKTSIIKAFASTYGFDIYIINMENIKTPEDIVQIFRGFDSAHSYHIICFEDIDRCPMFKKPTGYYGDSSDANSNPGIRTFLNELDGIVEGNKRITVFTANSIEVLDSIEALCRPGRIDKKIEIGYCDPTQLAQIYLHYTHVGSESNQNLTFTQEEFAGKKITPAHAVKIILSSPLITFNEFKTKLGIGPVDSNADVETPIVTQSTRSNQSTRFNRRTMRQQAANKKSFENLQVMISKERDVINELVELISVAGTTKEIKEKVPNILWGRQTRVKSINKILTTCKRKFDSNDNQEEE